MSAAKLSQIPIITKIHSSLIRILGCNPSPMTLQGTNTYLIGCGNRRILCDAGEMKKPDYISNLKKVLNDESATISDIILTHFHYDHIGGVKDVIGCLIDSKCTVWKHPRSDDEDSYPELDGLKLNSLENGQIFATDGVKELKVLHTPGHTTDHCILFIPDTSELFSGDCVLGEGTAVFEDLYDYMKSLELILTLNPSTIYPAHGSILKNPAEALRYYINHRNERESQILNALASNPNTWLSDMDLVEIIYTETPEQLWIAAAKNVSQHLNKLKKECKIESRQNDNHEVVWKYLIQE